MSVNSDKNLLNNCGCCESDTLEYPEHYNRPGQDAIKYRLDTHGGFLNRMLARLSRDQLTDAAAGKKRPLEKLTTRSDDDPSVAILDAWAVVADVLTFYQERIANEGFMRTATERRSVLELARAIGYELNPGVAASTWLAFTADNSPGSPPSANIPKGTQVLSIPGKDEVPQTFETTEEITARADWNALKPYTAVDTVTDPIVKGIKQLRLKGTGLGLKPGDGILIVGDERINMPESEFWDFRILTEVTKSDDNEYTLVKWERGLGHVQPPVSPAASNIKIYSFAINTAIFGKNAAEWDSLHNDSRAEYLEKLLGSTSNISVSKNGKTIVFAGNNNSLRVWTSVWNNDIGDYEWIKESIDIEEIGSGEIGDISCVTVSSSGTAIILGHSDGSLSKLTKLDGVWTRYAMPASGSAHDGVEVTQLAYSTTSSYVVSIDVEKTAKIWYVPGRTLQRTYIPQMTVTPVGGSTKYRVGSDGQSLSRWQFTTTWTETVVNPQAHDDIISSMAISSDATKIISGCVDGTLKIWTLSSGTWSSQEFLDNNEAAHAGPVIRVAFSNDAGNSEVISTSIDGITRRWYAGSRYLIRTFDNQTLDYLSDWPDYDLIAEPDAPQLMLEDHYPGIVNKSWVVLSQPSYVELYNVTSASKVWHSQFNISGDVTRLELDTSEHLNWFSRRETIVYAQNNKLELYAEEVLSKLPAHGNEIELDQLTPELEIERRVVVSGKRMRAVVIDDNELGTLNSADGFSTQPLVTNDVLIVISRPTPSTTCCTLTWAATDEGFVPTLSKNNTPDCVGVSCSDVIWHLQDRNGFEGSVKAAAGKIMLIPPYEDDESTSEVMVIDQLIETSHNARKLINTLIRFETSLVNIYDHDSVAINANVAPASHGETVPLEVMGSGNGTSINQRFVLNKNPLTYISAPTPTGGESTLDVRVNGVLWEQAASLYGLGPRNQNYIIRHDDDGNSIITFGDGRQGARLPTGQENITATYRSGIGPEGEVGSGTLRLLKSKPLGVREVNNPLPATGAAAPEVLADARSNAPMTVMTLDRIVSIDDFEDFAAAFSGIGKAQAVVLWNGQNNVVHITIATASGGTVSTNDQLYGNLLAALDKARDTTVQVLVDSYDEIRFMVEAQILVDDRYLRENVEEDVKSALKDTFTFVKRSFAQMVTEAEVLSVILGVEGVIAAELIGDKLKVTKGPVNPPFPDLKMDHLRADKAHWDPDNPTETKGAQLLLINSAPGGIVLREMAS